MLADAQRKAAATLARAEQARATGNARLAVRLLNQATTSQARRLTAASRCCARMATICAEDIPGTCPPGRTVGRTAARPVSLDRHRRQQPQGGGFQ